MKDQVLKEFRNACITPVGTYCRKNSHYGRHAFMRVN